MTVSVVIPTRNRGSRVSIAVESALGQTHWDLEVIVVDDASDDETPEILHALESRDDRLLVVRRDERGGAARARNMGAFRSKGEFISFLDDDCVWHPRKLEAQLASMGSRHGAAYSRQATLDIGGQWVVEGRPLPSSSPVDGLLRTNFIGNPSLMVKRKVFTEIGGFDADLPRLQDWDLALKLALRTDFAFVPEVLVRSVMLDGGISTSSEPLQRAAELMVERHADHLTTRQLGALNYGLAKFLLVDGQRAAAIRFFRRATRLDPASTLNWMGLLAGLLGPAPARIVRSLRRRRAARGREWITEDCSTLFPKIDDGP